MTTLTTSTVPDVEPDGDPNDYTVPPRPTRPDCTFAGCDFIADSLVTIEYPPAEYPDGVTREAFTYGPKARCAAHIKTENAHAHAVGALLVMESLTRVTP